MLVHWSYVFLALTHWNVLLQNSNNKNPDLYIDGLVQGRCNSIANALELRLFALTHRNVLLFIVGEPGQ